MVSRDEAVQRARQWLASGSVPAEVDIEVFEFDLGYVVWPRPAARVTGVLPEVGGARAVIDRATGELTTWPMLPPETIAQRYAVAHAAAGRFPRRVLADLRAANWRPGRNVETAVRRWLDQSGVGRVLPIFPAALAALREFGGLTFAQRGLTGAPGKGWSSSFYPGGNPPTTAEIIEFGQIIDTAVFPLGDNVDGPSHLVIDETGRVFRLHPVYDFYVGGSIDEAMVWITQGGECPTVDSSGHW